MLRKLLVAAGIVSGAGLMAAGCSHDSKHGVGKVTIDSGKFDFEQGGERIEIPNGDYVQIEKYNGIEYVPVEGVMSDADFKLVLQSATEFSVNKKDRLARLQQPLDDTLKVLQEAVPFIRVKTHAEVGYFSALVPRNKYSDLGKVGSLPYSVVLNPVVTQKSANMIQRINDAELIKAMGNLGSKDTADFSGLKSMGVPQFLKTIKEELGVEVDGSSVKVGVSDTGITLNHPSFEDAQGKSRVIYMKDFTPEGRMYINPMAKFAVSVPDEIPDGVDKKEVLMVNAEILPPARTVVTLPAADQFLPIEGPILVSEKLRAKLLNPDNGVRMGVIFEGAFAAEAEKADVNQNGKTDDLFFALVVSGEKEVEVYLSFSADMDFRKSQPVRDWNTTGDSVRLGAEKIGFDIRPTVLQTSFQMDMQVLGISMVGYDPGNHGTHVSGIIGGRKTITNDKDDTLARGAAPNVKLMLDRVCANNGGCRATEAIVDLAINGADVINMSLGGLSPFNDGYGVQEAVINRLTELEDVLFMVSAGNSGPGLNTVGSPSTARHAISVGATATSGMIQKQYQWSGKGTATSDNAAKDKDRDFMMFFSSRGPSANGGFKPNLTAPGTELSAVQLHSTQGARSGMDVYWGTSMAAPSATGAAALLLDAARKYNEKNPDAKLKTDALTLRRVLLASAKPFDVTRFDPKSGSFTQGQYTWIDQGMGMINLPAAWKLLKKETERRLPSAVHYEEDGQRVDVALNYEVRVADSYRNGGTYNGTTQLPQELASVIGPIFGNGLWLNLNDDRSLFKAQIARRLPSSALERDNAGDLHRLLKTTMDQFKIETVFYGSNQEWLKAGTFESLDCANSATKELVLMGEGAVDPTPGEAEPAPSARESSLMVCVDRATTHSLPAGDHGALIFAYRKDGRNVEATPSFVVPVYLNVPEKTLSGHDAYKVAGAVQSMGVGRHYVDVPKGTSFLTLTLTVPQAKTVDGATTECSGVRLYVMEAGNMNLPPEISGPDPTKSIARNCDLEGGAEEEYRTITFTRVNPNPGIWDVHVFGRYMYEHSPYEIKVDFARAELSVAEIVGAPGVLNGELNLKLVDYSVDPKPDSAKSKFLLNAKTTILNEQVDNQTVRVIPGPNDKPGHSYGDDITSVKYSTSNSPGNDLDLTVVECDNAELSQGCAVIGQSAGSSADETVSFIPNTKKFYGAAVVGYEVKDEGNFVFKEAATSKNAEFGKLNIASSGTDQYTVGYEFDVEGSALIKALEASDGSYELGGEIQFVTEGGSLLATVPVRVHKTAGGVSVTKN